MQCANISVLMGGLFSNYAIISFLEKDLWNSIMQFQKLEDGNVEN
jgi:hypothetical protein